MPAFWNSLSCSHLSEGNGYSIWQGLQHVIYYLDDILVTATTDEEHLQNLGTVLRRLKENGLRLKDKCHIWQSSVDYFGYHGIRVAPAKVDAIQQAPVPCNVGELCSFLEMINYYGKFVPNLSILVHPLHVLLKAGQSLKWDQACEEAFQAAKLQLSSSPVLVHYNPKLPIRLAGDASS